MKFKGKHLYQSFFLNKVAGLLCKICQSAGAWIRVYLRIYLYARIYGPDKTLSGIFYKVGCIKRDSGTGVFLQIYKIFKNLFLHNTFGRVLLKLSFSFVSVLVLTYIYEVFKHIIVFIRRWPHIDNFIWKNKLINSLFYLSPTDILTHSSTNSSLQLSRKCCLRSGLGKGLQFLF